MDKSVQASLKELSGGGLLYPTTFLENSLEADKLLQLLSEGLKTGDDGVIWENCMAGWKALAEWPSRLLCVAHAGKGREEKQRAVVQMNRYGQSNRMSKEDTVSIQFVHLRGTAVFSENSGSDTSCQHHFGQLVQNITSLNTHRRDTTDVVYQFDTSAAFGGSYVTQAVSVETVSGAIDWTVNLGGICANQARCFSYYVLSPVDTLTFETCYAPGHIDCFGNRMLTELSDVLCDTLRGCYLVQPFMHTCNGNAVSAVGAKRPNVPESLILAKVTRKLRGTEFRNLHSAIKDFFPRTVGSIVWMSSAGQSNRQKQVSSPACFSFFSFVPPCCTPGTAYPHPAPIFSALRLSVSSLACDGAFPPLVSGDMPVQEMAVSPVKSLHWEQFPPMSQHRVYCTPVYHEGLLYVLGGCSETGMPLDSVEVLDVESQTWSQLPPLTTARAGASAVALGGQVMVLGGMNQQQTPLASVEMYHPDEGKWETKASLGQPSMGVTAVERVSETIGLTGQLSPLPMLSDRDICSAPPQPWEGRGGAEWDRGLRQKRWGYEFSIDDDWVLQECAAPAVVQWWAPLAKRQLKPEPDCRFLTCTPTGGPSGAALCSAVFTASAGFLGRKKLNSSREQWSAPTSSTAGDKADGWKSKDNGRHKQEEKQQEKSRTIAAECFLYTRVTYHCISCVLVVISPGFLCHSDRLMRLLEPGWVLGEREREETGGEERKSVSSDQPAGPTDAGLRHAFTLRFPLLTEKLPCHSCAHTTAVRFTPHKADVNFSTGAVSMLQSLPAPEDSNGNKNQLLALLDGGKKCNIHYTVPECGKETHLACYTTVKTDGLSQAVCASLDTRGMMGNDVALSPRLNRANAKARRVAALSSAHLSSGSTTQSDLSFLHKQPDQRNGETGASLCDTGKINAVWTVCVWACVRECVSPQKPELCTTELSL
ncbi:hypothetical protein CCH79_00016420 [Gambusia affinis]|uniref:Kelch domain-containing protein 8B n=1 Tax=Gambusia affinis TaxID=33528 RepID=A0A315WBL9_GAMAF|nr:hypothetical protein CCH79_00016420 [Gambusia affinis]